jgi:hypothetical protein
MWHKAKWRGRLPNRTSKHVVFTTNARKVSGDEKNKVKTLGDFGYFLLQCGDGCPLWGG